MKLKLTLLGLAATATLATAQIFTTNVTGVATAGNTIYEYNPAGMTETFTAADLAGAITNISISLDISGGFNGSLYAYLAGPQGQLAVLLNRPGISGSNPYGSGDAGMNITLSETAAINIHDYAANPSSYTVTGGQVTGVGTTTFLADGRVVDPMSSGGTIGGTTPTAGLSLFNTTTGDGTWTLFIADLAPGGGNATLNSAVLTIMTAPEPQTWGMLAGGLAMLALFRRRSNF
jgi:subtilisin-like proprotein convertase family protein